MHFFDEKFWVAFATVTFFVLVFKPMKRAINSMLDDRISKIKKELAEAKRLREEAQSLLNEAERKLSQSEKDAAEIISHAKKESVAIIKNAKEKLEKDVEVRKKLAMQKIQSFEENAINELKKNISSITVNAAQQILEETTDEEAFKKLINVSLDKVSKTVH